MMRPCVVFLTKELSQDAGFSKAFNGYQQRTSIHDAQSKRKQDPGQDDWRLSNGRLLTFYYVGRKHLRPLIVLVKVEKQTIGLKCACFM